MGLIGNLSSMDCNSGIVSLNHSPHTFIEIIFSLPLIQVGLLSVTDNKVNTLRTGKKPAEKQCYKIID